MSTTVGIVRHIITEGPLECSYRIGKTHGAQLQTRVMLVRCTDDFPFRRERQTRRKKRSVAKSHRTTRQKSIMSQVIPCFRRTEIDRGGNSRYMGRGNTADTRTVHEAERSLRTFLCTLAVSQLRLITWSGASQNLVRSINSIPRLVLGLLVLVAPGSATGVAVVCGAPLGDGQLVPGSRFVECRNTT
jgi:hypothetical protein